MLARPVHRVVVLVHPFYSLWWGVQDRTRLRKAFQFLSGKWSKKIRDAAADSSAILIFVGFRNKRFELNEFKSNEIYDGEGRKLGSYSGMWYANKIAKFEAHAEKALGNRFFFCPSVVPTEGLLHEIKNRGFRLNHRMEGESFGEYWKQCVSRETHAVESALGIRVNENPVLSVSFPQYRRPRKGTHDRFNQTMGPFNPYLPKTVQRRSAKRNRKK